MRRQALWIAISVATAALTTTAVHADFIDDSQVQLKFKNFYLDREYEQEQGRAVTKGYGNWTQAVTLDAKSGYHDVGAGVQVGVDVLAQYAVGLNSRGQVNDIHMPYNASEGRTERDNAKIGATLKLKYSETELKVGELLPTSPVIFYDPSRQLLTTYNGAWLESKDLPNTKLTLAYIDGINARYDNQYQDLTLFPQNDFASAKQKGLSTDDGMYIAGIDYQFTPELAGSYWYADVTNIYQQHYVGTHLKKNVTDKIKVDANVRYFDNSESGDALYGNIDSQALSAALNVSHGVHTLHAGWQQMFGEHGDAAATMFPTLGGWVPQPYLVNWSVASFIRKDEKSWNLGYSYDFKNVGIPGLSATFKHYHGGNIDGAYYNLKDGSGQSIKEGKEFENNLLVNYVIPEGKFKGLGFHWLFIDTHYNYANDLQEHRAAVTYTYKF